MPQLVAAAIDEMWNAANMAFELCPMLTGGAIEAIELNGSDALKRVYLPKMVAGEWTGTMNLTEPQAGSDLAAVRTKAVPQADGSYRISGNKIFITYGEHDYTENIVHLVLARTPDAPPGTKGISLFVVPKFLVNADGSLGARNDVRCVSLEHKLGIHASPTAVLAFGDHGGAVGHIVGEENRGLEYMFVMMNLARFGVGMQGVGHRRAGVPARRATMRASACRDASPARRRKPRGGIIGHPDVRRMLMTMRACTEAARALGYVTAAALDRAHRHPDADVRKRELAFAELMIPIVKGWSTGARAARRPTSASRCTAAWASSRNPAQRSTSRDARITTIYEGTTGIQANDLIGRKIARDGGKALLDRDRGDARRARALADAGDSDELAVDRHAPARRRRRARGRGALDRRALPARIRAPCSPARCRFSSSPASSAAARSSRAPRSSRHGEARGRRGRRGFPAREDRDRAPFRRSLPDPGARPARHRRRRRRRACSRSPTSSSDGCADLETSR